ncbi:PREDICTED: SRSF protein kinase 3-like [Nicrophorus vespilloides]|uniref:non-specific serine/threonine protein kinase n=1 Tax=Nicrophorus vespilloides TaxID=110193 RepID=A0ABM1NF47_NICVS|nr:PREDICTED: SRSF protein kinase 3-like [Nicrophorus vespilloides]
MTDSLKVLKDRHQKSTGPNLAPEVPNLQPSNRGAVSRSNSRDQEAPETVATENPSRARAAVIGEQQPSVLAAEKNYRFQRAADAETNILPRAYRIRYEELYENRSQRDDFFYRSKNNGGSNLLSLQELNATSSIDDISIDYTSLSLSPIHRRNDPSSHKTRSYCDRGKPACEYTEDDLKQRPSDQNCSQENLNEYKKGGYKPILIGEQLGTYTVLRKLGFGHFSTVWLCSDNREDQKYVAIKVLKAVHLCDNMAKEEISLLTELRRIGSDHPGRKHIIEMVEHFDVSSINGNHVCIGFELMGPSLLHLITQSHYQGIYEGAVKCIIRQVLLGLSYLHNKCKIIHTDLKPENILIKVNDAYIKNMVDKTTRYSELGLPMPRSYISSENYATQSFETLIKFAYSNPVMSPDEPERVQRSSSFPCLSDLTNDGETTKICTRSELYVSPKIEVKIADMGNACWTTDKIEGTIQTKQYRALEVLLGADFNTPADIWSVGCIAFELATGEYLFNPRHTQTFSSNEDHILLIYELLGGIPPYIASRGRRSHRYFDSTGNLIICEMPLLHIWKTEDVLVEKYGWKRVDAIPFAAMINAMIEPDPELRITADNGLVHQWLNDSSS